MLPIVSKQPGIAPTTPRVNVVPGKPALPRASRVNILYTVMSTRNSVNRLFFIYYLLIAQERSEFSRRILSTSFTELSAVPP